MLEAIVRAVDDKFSAVNRSISCKVFKYNGLFTNDVLFDDGIDQYTAWLPFSFDITHSLDNKLVASYQLPGLSKYKRTAIGFLSPVMFATNLQS